MSEGRQTMQECWGRAAMVHCWRVVGEKAEGGGSVRLVRALIVTMWPMLQRCLELCDVAQKICMPLPERTLSWHACHDMTCVAGMACVPWQGVWMPWQKVCMPYDRLRACHGRECACHGRNSACRDRVSACHDRLRACNDRVRACHGRSVHASVLHQM